MLASSGGNSTIRSFVPLSGGDIPMGLVAGSSRWITGQGDSESVSQRLPDASPNGPKASGTRLSNSVTALLFASSPVTTRRISDADAVAKLNIIVAIDQNILRSIVSSHFVLANLVGRGANWH